MNWISVHFLLILSELAGLESRTIDFVLAFPQAELDVPVYMELPLGMEVAGTRRDDKQYVLRLRKSLYGLKQASANWYDMLKKGLELRGFKESIADPCVFIKDSQSKVVSSTNNGKLPTFSESNPSKTFPIGADSVIQGPAHGSTYSSTIKRKYQSIDKFRSQSSDILVLVYVDDCIILSRHQTSIELFIDSLKHGPEEFDFTDKGSMDKYLGVEIERLPGDEGFSMTQPYLIERILEAAQIDLRMTNSRSTPVAGPLLSRDEKGPERKHTWNYRTLTGMLGYLQGTSRPDISMATHQCARLNSNPKLCHERAIKRI